MKNVTGTATLKLYKGSVTICGRRSAHSLYDEALASFDMTGYTPQDAGGFIRLFGLPNRGRRRLAPVAVGRKPRAARSAR